MKKGFTIAEMLGVVIILCVIAVIAFPPILNFVRNTENDLDEANRELAITAANQYVSRYNNDFPKTAGRSYYIYVEDLIKEDLTSNTLIENSILELDSCVKVSVNNSLTYEYSVEVMCSQRKEG